MKKQQSASMMKRRHMTSTPAAKRQQNHDEWKESFREACFERARKNRRDAIWKKRLNNASQREQPQQLRDNSNSNEHNSDVRTVVEQELREQGVAIVTPSIQERLGVGAPFTSISPTHSALRSAASLQPPQQSALVSESTKLDGERQGHEFSNNVTENYMSEAELYELLQELEEEVQRHGKPLYSVFFFFNGLMCVEHRASTQCAYMSLCPEENLLEKILERERHEELEMEEEIAHYQYWEEQLADNESVEQCVICPLCWESMLRQSPPDGGTISCLNDACLFQMDQQHGLLLTELKERLRLTLENHSVQCSGTLTFELQPTHEIVRNAEDSTSLVGSCHQCKAILSIT